jgi:hypothetical protein
MKQEKYKIIVEKKRVNYVKIYKSEGNGYVNDWNFPLKGNENSIFFKEFYIETKFAIVNWGGWVRVYDASNQ